MKRMQQAHANKEKSPHSKCLKHKRLLGKPAREIVFKMVDEL